MDSSGAFGPYRIVAPLGAGGMGSVYRAIDSRIGRAVALKILLPALAADRIYQARFRRESALLTAVEHPHVIPLHTAGEIEGRLYLDMRLIDGDDLASALRRRGRMPADRAVGTLDGIADALDFVHERGILHRDVKPSNVMLAGTRLFPYLLDFGIAQADTEVGLTQTGAVAGSLEFLAPERFAGHPPDARSDVYSLCGVLLTALTGQLPYPGRPGIAAQAYAHVNAPVPRPSGVDPALKPFDAVVARGMAKSVDDRYASGGELAEAAADALAGVAAIDPDVAARWQIAPSRRVPVSGDAVPAPPTWSPASPSMPIATTWTPPPAERTGLAPIAGGAVRTEPSAVVRGAASRGTRRYWTAAMVLLPAAVLVASSLRTWFHVDDHFHFPATASDSVASSGIYPLSTGWWGPQHAGRIGLLVAWAATATALVAVLALRHRRGVQLGAALAVLGSGVACAVLAGYAANHILFADDGTYTRAEFAQAQTSSDDIDCTTPKCPTDHVSPTSVDSGYVLALAGGGLQVLAGGGMLVLLRKRPSAT